MGVEAGTSHEKYWKQSPDNGETLKRCSCHMARSGCSVRERFKVRLDAIKGQTYPTETGRPVP